MKSFSRFHKMALAALTTGLLMIPQVGMGENTRAYNLVSQAQAGDADGVEDQFFEMADDIETSQDPIVEARQFLESLLIEVNKQTGAHFTFEEICQMAKDNITLFEIPEDKQEIYLKTFDLLLAKDPEAVQAAQAQLDDLLDKNMQLGAGHKHHHHRHHWKKVLIVSAAVFSAVLISFVVPVAGPLAVDGAIMIIKSTVS